MRLLFAALCTAALLWTPARADDAAKNAKIQELMKLSKSDQMVTQIFEQVKTMAATQFDNANMTPEARKTAEDVQARVLALVQQRMSKLMEMVVQAYADTYTEPEIDGILAFYKSPAGQAMVAKMPMLMQRTMSASQQMMGDLMPEVQKIAEEARAKAQQKK